MKRQSTVLFEQISAKHLEKLTTIAKETLVPGFDQPQGKIFTSTDFWNIQRQGKRRIQRRIFA